MSIPLRRLVFTVAATLALLAAGGCKKSKDGAKNLPPATGSGAKPLPELPAVGSAGSGSASGSAVPDTGPSAVSGTLEPREQVQVAPKASGTITNVSVDEGSKIKKGDVLFRLDSRDAQLMKKQAQTQLASAQLALKTAQREYDRIKGLVAQNAVPGAQLDPLEAQVEGSKLQITAARNSIAMADKAIGDATVRSPLTGVVIKKLMSVGEYATMMPPSPVVVVQDQSSLELRFHLPERSLTSLHQNDPVTVAIPSLGVTRVATIAQISPQVDPRTRTIEATALLDNCDGALRPGLAAEVSLGTPASDATVPDCAASKPGKAGKPAAAATSGKAAP
jgi:RND family efflux transporter MFP subunit